MLEYLLLIAAGLFVVTVFVGLIALLIVTLVRKRKP